ncbi:hypothetical protein [Arthrobacter castelli]|uniref:hypothetical protein n=1 Tax=Arthrobacter castelli TaxID=271431 RepID=UPI00041F240E|nr:hypothetical protein [Arthrobacter castelli]
MTLSDLLGNHDAEYVQVDRCTPENTRTFPYQREPYVRASIPLKAGGTATVDGKAIRWCHAAVLVHWEEESGPVHNVWVAPENLRRIGRDESSWNDPYDILD